MLYLYIVSVFDCDVSAHDENIYRFYVFLVELVTQSYAVCAPVEGNLHQDSEVMFNVVN